MHNNNNKIAKIELVFINFSRVPDSVLNVYILHPVYSYNNPMKCVLSPSHWSRNQGSKM